MSKGAGFTPLQMTRQGDTVGTPFVTGFTLTELAFIIVIIAIFIVILAPFIANIRARADLLACEENLREIGLGLKLYASEHRGKFPSSLDELTEGGYVEDEMVFDCPSRQCFGDAQEPDYVYIPGHTVLSSSDSVIVSDKDESHKAGKYALYISGDIILATPQNRENATKSQSGN